MFLTRREPAVPLSLFRSYPLPFSPPFLLYCSLITLPFLLCLFHWSISAVVSREGIISANFPCFSHCSHMFLTRREPGVPLSLFQPYPLPFSPPFLLYCSLITLPFLLCLFNWSISAVVSGEGILSVLFPCFSHCSHMFLTRREAGVPLSLFRSYPLPFSPPFLLYCSLPFLFFYVFFIDLYLLWFPGRHSICCFPRCSHMFLTRREPGMPLSLFRPYPLPFSPPFLLYCSFPFLFFYVFFIDLYLL